MKGLIRVWVPKTPPAGTGADVASTYQDSIRTVRDVAVSFSFYSVPNIRMKWFP